MFNELYWCKHFSSGAISLHKNLYFMLQFALQLLQIRIITQDVFQYIVKIIKQQGRYVQKTLWSLSVHFHNTVNLTYKPEAGKKSNSP